MCDGKTWFEGNGTFPNQRRASYGAANITITGVSVKIDGVMFEDAAWLRRKCDYNHINVAELEATVKDVNLALKWD